MHSLLKAKKFTRLHLILISDLINLIASEKYDEEFMKAHLKVINRQKKDKL